MATEFVTPTSSPSVSRLSLGVGPISGSPGTPRQLRLVVLQEAEDLDELPNNDEAEKQERHKARRMEIQQQSPSVPGDRRRSLLSGLAGLSGNQVAEHYSNCIKLSSENKITTKNAFSLHLIDCMEDMLRKKDSEMNNFQVASCTLDASAKIYAYRVDCVHADTYKIVGGILRTAEKKAKKGNRLAEDDNQAEGSPNEDEDVVVKKKKSRKKSTIEQNLKNINLNKFEIEYMIDPLFQKMRSDFDEGGTGGLLLNNLRSCDDSGELRFDSKCAAFSKPEPRSKTSEPKAKVDFSVVQNLLKKVTGDKVICPHFQDFSFLHWVPETNVDPSSKDNFAFNPDSLPDPVVDASIMDGGFDDRAADDFFGEDDPCEERAACAAKPKTVRLDVSDLISVLADEPSDYSYFDASYMSSWAGPNHWKTKPISKDKPSATDARRKRNQKPPFRVGFEDSDTMDAFFDKTPGPVSTLSAASKNLWKGEKITLPVDLHYDAKTLLQLFGKPKMRVAKQKSAKSDVDDAVGQYDYDNTNDCGEYCPGEVPNDGPSGEGSEASRYFVNDDSNDLFSQTCFDNNATTMFSETANPAEEGFTGDNLVQQPNKVAKINIQYAKTAKRVDVQKMKMAMWKIVAKGDENGSGDEDQMVAVTPVSFSDLYKRLPNFLSGQTLDNLSVPMALVCLLYLVNEKSLTIKGQEDLSNFTVSQNETTSR